MKDEEKKGRMGETADDNTTQKNTSSSTMPPIQEASALRESLALEEVFPQQQEQQQLHPLIQAKQRITRPSRGGVVADDQGQQRLGAFKIRGQAANLTATGKSFSYLNEEESSCELPLPVAAEVVACTNDDDDMIEREIQRRVQEQVATRLVAEVVVDKMTTTTTDNSRYDESFTDNLTQNSKKEIPDESHTKAWYSWAAAIIVVVVAVVVVMVLVFTLPSTREDDADPDTMAKVESWPPDDTVIAYVPQTLCFERVPYLGRSELDECKDRRMARGSGFMNLVAASRLWNFRGDNVDLSIANGGEIQGDAKAGNFTVGDAKELLPWDNSLVILQIQGSDIVTVLERSMQRLVDNFLLLQRQNSTEKLYGGPYPYGAVIRFAVNMNNAFPNQLSNVEVNT